MNEHPDHLPDQLAGELDRLADEDAAQVLSEARANANARVRALLEDALVTRLLARATAPGESNRLADADVAPEVQATRSRARDEEEALYMYGIVAADAVETIDMPGVGPGNPVEVVARERLAAVVSRVPLSEFGDEHLKENLERMDWLEQTARRHEAVLEGVRRRSTVIPMRICTLFHSVDSVREMLGRESAPLQRALDRLSGCDEWGVKALVEIASAQRALATNARTRVTVREPTSGRGYLEGKQAERRSANELRGWIRDVASELHDALTAAATAGLRNPLQPQELSGYQDEMVLNGAYLVPEDRHEKFSGLVAELGERYREAGLRLELTGPWPPYNFVPPLTAT